MTPAYIPPADPPHKTADEDGRAGYYLYPRQMEAMRRIVQDGVHQMLYGGAAGGGKSALLRALAYTLAQWWPGARIAIFRENYTMLEKTQIVEWRKEMRGLGYDIDSPKVWAASAHEFRFSNGSVVEFLHIDPTLGAEKWLSAQWAALLVDEASQIAEQDLRMLYSRVRATVQQQAQWKFTIDPTGEEVAWRPLAVYASNPGGESHRYLYDTFVAPSRALPETMSYWDDIEQVQIGSLTVDTVIRRSFLQAFVTDNLAIDARQYAAQLAQITGGRSRQMLSGDWDYFEGKTFSMLDPEIHLVDADDVFGGLFMPPADWPRLAGLDHGTTSPTAAEWVTRDDDNFLIAGYLEYYSPGAVGTHIREIRSLMQVDGVYDVLFMADPRMWHRSRGRGEEMWSVADEYALGGTPPEDARELSQAMARGIHLKQSTVERLAGRLAMQRLLEPQPDLMFPSWHKLRGRYGAPRMFITRSAPNLWRELNGIQNVPDTEETMKQDDHAYDAIYRAATVFEQALGQATYQRGAPTMTFGYRPAPARQRAGARR